MRDCSSVRLIWSVGRGPSTGGWGGLPRGFRPVAAALASRAASLASWSACSRSKRSLARASILARARPASPDAPRGAPVHRGSTGRRGGPPGPPPRPWPATRPPRPSTAPRSCRHAHRTARCGGWHWRGSWCRPVPILSTPISRATASTWTNRPSISWRNRRRNAAIVS